MYLAALQTFNYVRGTLPSRLVKGVQAAVRIGYAGVAGVDEAGTAESLPCGVRGPVDLSALARLARIWAGVAILEQPPLLLIG